MSDRETHYRDLLAEHYSWMFGDYDAAVDRFRAMGLPLSVNASSGALHHVFRR